MIALLQIPLASSSSIIIKQYREQYPRMLEEGPAGDAAEQPLVDLVVIS